MNEQLKLTTLGHTWILDLDGTIVRHNGYKINGYDAFLDGAKDFLNGIPEKDMIIFITSRKDKYKDMTEKFLKSNAIRYDAIIFNAPYGERILINDDKPTGTKMAFSVNISRDNPFDIYFIEDETL